MNKNSSSTPLASVYQDPEYKLMFEREASLRDKLETLNREECELRLALEKMCSTHLENVPALAAAVAALDGAENLPSRNAAIDEARTQHIAVKERMSAIRQGLPHAHFETRRRREMLTRERISQPDVQQLIARQLAAVHELLASNRAMAEACDKLARSGFGTGQVDAARFALTVELDPAVPDSMDALVAWAAMLKPLKC